MPFFRFKPLTAFTLLSLAGLAGLPTLSAAQAAPRDPFVGEWGGNCENGAQCWLEIDKKGKLYSVAFVAADRMDASKILCRVDSTMERGYINYGPHEMYDDGLNGLVLGSVTYIAAGSDGSIGLGGGLTAGLARGKFIMQQAYYPIAD